MGADREIVDHNASVISMPKKHINSDCCMLNYELGVSTKMLVKYGEVLSFLDE